MNLVSTLQIQAGGPGSGCNPAAGKCGRPAGSGLSNDVDSKPIQDALSKSLDPLVNYKSYPPAAIKGAAKDLADAGTDPRLLENRAPAKIIVGKIIKNQSVGRGKYISGQYNPRTGDIAIRDPNDVGSFLHELSHHLDNAWLYPAQNSSGFTGGPEIDQAKNADMRSGMLWELTTARDNAEMQLGSKEGWSGGDARFAFIRDRLERIHVNAPRVYSLSNLREWFATSFEEYMASPYQRVRLERIAPKTYDYIDSFIHGKLFKNASN